jgi:hypothetical protein
MANQISDFINGFRGGTRKNRFKVSGTFPDSTDSAKLEFHEPWDILVLDDRGSGMYNAFQAWSELINNQEFNTHNYGDDDSWFQEDDTGAIQDATWKIQQLDLGGLPIKTITLRSCWPGFISPLQFNMAETGFNSFAVRLNYNYINIENINDIG